MSYIDNFIKGMEILNKYKGSDLSAEHDVVYAGPDAADIKVADAVELVNLGWHLDEDLNVYAFYV